MPDFLKPILHEICMVGELPIVWLILCMVLDANLYSFFKFYFFFDNTQNMKLSRILNSFEKAETFYFTNFY